MLPFLQLCNMVEAECASAVTLPPFYVITKAVPVNVKSDQQDEKI